MAGVVVAGVVVAGVVVDPRTSVVGTRVVRGGPEVVGPVVPVARGIVGIAVGLEALSTVGVRADPSLSPRSPSELHAVAATHMTSSAAANLRMAVKSNLTPCPSPRFRLPGLVEHWRPWAVLLGI